MSALRLQHFINDPQYFLAKDGRNMSEEIFLHNLIREFATYRDGSYSLFVCELPRHEKILLLSYCIPADDIEWAQKDSHLMDTLIAECSDQMQVAIDNVIDEVYHEDMREMGLSLCHHSDNNEPYYIKR